MLRTVDGTNLDIALSTTGDYTDDYTDDYTE